MSRVKTMLPQLRFEGFSDEWVNKKVGDFGAVKMCKRIFKDQTSDKEKIPFYKIGTFGGIPDAYISEELYKEYLEKYPYPEVGDILISAAGTIGRTVIYNGEKAYYQDSNIVWLDHDKRSLSNAFFYQFLEVTNWNELEGSTIKRLYNSHLLGKEINIPSLDEQTKIGELFQKLDRAIELQQQKVEQSERYKKAMLQKMFPQKGEKVPRVRFAGFSGEWEENRLKEVISSEFKGKAQLSKLKNGDVEYLDAERLNGGMPYLSNAELDVDYKDILILWDGSKAGTVYKGFQGALGSTLKAYKIMKKHSSEFIYQSLKYRQAEIFEKYRTPNIPHVIKDFTELFKIKLPSLEEQTQIGNFFEILDQQIEQQAQKLATYQQLKKAMLQRMFV